MKFLDFWHSYTLFCWDKWLNEKRKQNFDAKTNYKSEIRRAFIFIKYLYFLFLCGGFALFSGATILLSYLLFFFSFLLSNWLWWSARTRIEFLAPNRTIVISSADIPTLMMLNTDDGLYVNCSHFRLYDILLEDNGFFSLNTGAERRRKKKRFQNQWKK